MFYPPPLKKKVLWSGFYRNRLLNLDCRTSGPIQGQRDISSRTYTGVNLHLHRPHLYKKV